MRWGWFAVAAVGLVLPARPASGDAWTNQAGHVVEGELAGYSNRTVTIRRLAGGLIDVPLAVLRPADQQRILSHYGESTVPDFVRSGYGDAMALLARYDRLPEERRSTEERQRVAAQAQAVFDARLAAHGTLPEDAAVRAEIVRLRALIR